MIQAIVVISGALMVLGAFLAALKNMGTVADPDSSFDDAFKVHLKAIGFMAVGSFMFIGGSIWYLLTRMSEIQ